MLYLWETFHISPLEYGSLAPEDKLFLVASLNHREKVREQERKKNS
jgi:hypothetical protein